MKNSIQKLIAVALTAIVLLGTSLTVSAADQTTVTILNEVKKVNKISVAGNVELILVQSADENVKVYDSYFSKNALVQQKDNELRISSFNKETLTVVVYVNNLTEISAADNASVKTFGKFNALSLNVKLKDQATATLNTNTISLFTDVAGQSQLTLTGTTLDYTSVMGSIAKINLDGFTAESTSISAKNTLMANVAVTNTLPTEDILFAY